MAPAQKQKTLLGALRSNTLYWIVSIIGLPLWERREKEVMDTRRRREEYSEWVLFASRFCSAATENVPRNSHKWTCSRATSSWDSWTPNFPFLSRTPREPPLRKWWCHPPPSYICEGVLATTKTAAATRTSISNRFINQNRNFARASRFFVYFFAATARLRRENAQLRVLWEA